MNDIFLKIIKFEPFKFFMYPFIPIILLYLVLEITKKIFGDNIKHLIENNEFLCNIINNIHNNLIVFIIVFSILFNPFIVMFFISLFFDKITIYNAYGKIFTVIFLIIILLIILVFTSYTIYI